ncbi:MAG: hypothetical protein ACXVEF_34120 [Polyangiales bacterium]
MLRRLTSDVMWGLIYALILVAVGVFDRLVHPDDPGAGRRLWSFLALLVLAFIAAAVDVRRRPPKPER